MTGRNLMRLYRIVPALLISVAVVGPARAAAEGLAGPSLTVNELVARALRDNPELRAARTAIDAARGQLRQARLRPNPMLDLNGSQNVAGPDNMQTIGISWPLDLAGPQPADVADELEAVPAVPDQSAAMTQALAERPDLQAAVLEEQLASARVDKERAEGRYDASLVAQYQRQDTGFDLMAFNSAGRLKPIQDVFHYVTFGVSITLPVGNRNQGTIAAARADLEGSQRRR